MILSSLCRPYDFVKTRQNHSLQRLDKIIGSKKTRQNHSLQRLDKNIGSTKTRQNHSLQNPMTLSSLCRPYDFV
jgi:hypothetical protein